jgi:NodT family efflux transporter outer membrane factor (OMF) lipoprotein
MNRHRTRPLHRRRARLCVLGCSTILFGGCTVGPKYVRPTASAPVAYKEPSDEWKQATPSDAMAKGRWWEIYQDPQLNSLEDQVTSANQTLKAAQDAFAAARAAVRGTRAQYYPTVTGGLQASGTRASSNKPGAAGLKTFDDIQIPFDVSYEPDLWGRVRKSVEVSQAEAQASAADLANTALSLHAELALDYFDLRSMDSQAQLLGSTVDSYTQALSLTQSRYNGGLASGVDVAQAQTQLESTRVQLIGVGVQRAADEHAIAVLVGKAAYDLKLDPLPLGTPAPAIPPGLPSDLLERRPDVAASERAVAAANAQIGIAQTAFYPNVTLTGAGGFDSGRITTLLQGPAGFWSLAGSAAETLFDAGARRAVVQQAQATYDESVDNYRQTVLVAFQEVEDSLSSLRILEEEAKASGDAVAAAQHSLELSESRYRGGVANYLEVTTAQSAALVDERSAVDILAQRMLESVQLIKALGGGWDASQLPSAQALRSGQAAPGAAPAVPKS